MNRPSTDTEIPIEQRLQTRAMVVDELESHLESLCSQLARQVAFYGGDRADILEIVTPIERALIRDCDAMRTADSLELFVCHKKAMQKELQRIEDTFLFSQSQTKPDDATQALIYFFLDVSFMAEAGMKKKLAAEYENLILKAHKLYERCSAQAALKDLFDEFIDMLRQDQIEAFRLARAKLLHNIEQQEAYVLPEYRAIELHLNISRNLLKRLDRFSEKHLSPLKTIKARWQPFAWVGLGIALMLPTLLFAVLAPGNALIAILLGVSVLAYSGIDVLKETFSIRRAFKKGEEKPPLASRIRRFAFFTASSLGLAAGALGAFAVIATSIFPPAVPIVMAIAGLAISATFITRLVYKAVKAQNAISSAESIASSHVSEVDEGVSAHQMLITKQPKPQLVDVNLEEYTETKTTSDDIKRTQSDIQNVLAYYAGKSTQSPSFILKPQPRPSDKSLDEDEGEREGEAEGPHL